jgi:hypothetical protein
LFATPARPQLGDDHRPETALHADDMIGDIRHTAEDGQLGDRGVRGAVPPPLGVRVVLDRGEGERPARGRPGEQRGTGVDGGQADTVVVAAHEAGSIDGEDIVGPAPVAPGIEELGQALGMQPGEHPFAERAEPRSAVMPCRTFSRMCGRSGVWSRITTWPSSG